MKIWVLSDLHIDRNPDLDLGPHPGCDVIVMAGDLSDGDCDPTAWLLTEFSDYERSRLLFVPGNHEHYDVGLDGVGDRMQQLEAATGIAVLQQKSIEIDGQRFVGCTMWTRLEERLDTLGGDLAFIPDFTGDRWREMHAWHRAFLETEVQEGNVVITHHAPSWAGLSMDMQHNPRLASVASGYYSYMQPLIEERQPALWIHGHTHVTTEYDVAGCKVVSNGRGSGWNSRFQPGYVVEIGGYQPKPPGW